MKKDRYQEIDIIEFLIGWACTALSVILVMMMLWGAGEVIADFAGHWIDNKTIEYTGGSL